MTFDGRTIEKKMDHVLLVQLNIGPGIRYFYDFHAKVVHTLISGGSDNVIPFSQLDQETLKSYRDKLIELGGHPPELHSASAESWIRIGSDAIAHMGTYPEIGQKLTTVFNLASRERFIITDDLKTGIKAVTPLTSFDSYIPLPIIEKALAQFKQQGGECDEEFVRTGKSNLKKNAL